MQDALRTQFAALPPMTRRARVLACKVCGGRAPFFDAVDFFKCCSAEPYGFGYSGIPVEYYQCEICDFAFTDLIDDWTGEEIQAFIYNDEYIKVDPEYLGARAERDAAFFIDILGEFRDSHAVLDYGSGTGVLASRMREAGFDAEAYDPYSSPHRPTRRFDIITCMEVLEHSPDPVGSLRDMAGLLNEGGCLLIGTGVQPENFADIRANWWYAGPRNGHISLQSVFSLTAMARDAGLTSYPSDRFCGFAGAPSPAVAAFLARMGRPLLGAVLLAPGEGAPRSGIRASEAGWHDLERGRFRWTGTQELVWEWHPEPIPADVVLRLPTAMQIGGDFLQRCRLFVDGAPAACRVLHGVLTAKATVSGHTPVLIRLETPPPPVAHDVNGCDDRRHLGLAVLADVR